MDRAVREWRAARRAQAEAEGSTNVGTPAAPDFGAGVRRSIPREPSMTDRLRADKLGVPVSQLPSNLRTPSRGETDDAA